MHSLKPCPDTPNCVSSLAEDSGHYIAPLNLDKSIQWPQTVVDILSSVRGITIVTTNENYIHAECRTLLFRFIDDLELVWDAENNICHVRSASRVGRSDLGVNRKRVEKIRHLLSGNT